jgi:hypothetical protein
MDESHLTGEPDDVPKSSAAAQALYSGSKALSGTGRAVVTAVGPNSQAGAIAAMVARRGGGGGGGLGGGGGGLADPLGGPLREETLLQRKLAGYAGAIGRAGLAAAVVATAGMAARFSWATFVEAGLPWDWAYLHDYLRFFITGVTILVSTATPRGAASQLVGLVGGGVGGCEGGARDGGGGARGGGPARGHRARSAARLSPAQQRAPPPAPRPCIFACSPRFTSRLPPPPLPPSLPPLIARWWPSPRGCRWR